METLDLSHNEMLDSGKTASHLITGKVNKLKLCRCGISVEGFHNIAKRLRELPEKVK